MKNILNSKEVQEVIRPLFDPFDWEYHCGACDYFEDKDRCPNYGHVTSETYYEDIGCKNFWD